MRDHQRKHVLELCDWTDRGHGPKDLVAADRHGRRHRVKDARSDKEALIGQRPLATVKRKVRAFCRTTFYVAEDATAMFGTDDRSHVHTGFHSVSDSHAAGRFDEAITRLCVNRAHRHKDAPGEAAFTRATVEGLVDDRDRAIEIGVRHHNDEVLGAARAWTRLPA